MNTQSAESRVSEHLIISGKPGSQMIRCNACGKDICPANTEWRTEVTVRQRVLSDVVPLVSRHPAVYLHEYICPGCGTMLETQIVLHQEQAPS